MIWEHPLAKPLLSSFCCINQVAKAYGSEADECVVYTVEVRPVILYVVKEDRWQDDEDENTRHNDEENSLPSMPFHRIEFFSLKKKLTSS